MKKSSKIRNVISMLLALSLILANGVSSIHAEDDTGNVVNSMQRKTYQTIQSAVDDANEGDTISIGAGVYDENISIQKDITLKGAGKNATSIRFNPEQMKKYMYSGYVEVYPTIYSNHNLTLESLSISGPTGGHGIDGVYVENGSLLMKDVAALDIRSNQSNAIISGAQNGRGILVAGNGNVSIEDCNIKSFQKNAIDVNTAGAITILNNVIEGVGAQNLNAQNGIVLRGVGKAVIANNAISGLQYTNTGDAWPHASFGVILMNAMQADINMNEFTLMDNGISIANGASASIERNIFRTNYWALDADTVGTVSAPNNFWNGEIAEKVNGKVEGIDQAIEDPDVPSVEVPDVSDPNPDTVTPGINESDKESVANTIKDTIAHLTADSGNNIDVVNALLKAKAEHKVIETSIEAKTLKMSDVDKKEVTMIKDAVDTIAQQVNAKHAEIAQILDLRVTASVEGSEIGELNVLSQPINFTIAMPSEMQNVKNRQYYVIRIHEGEVTRLQTIVNSNQTLSFATDRFSTYALVYVDGAKDAYLPGDEVIDDSIVLPGGKIDKVVTKTNSSSSPDTSTNVHILPYMSICLIALGLLVIVRKKTSIK